MPRWEVCRIEGDYHSQAWGAVGYSPDQETEVRIARGGTDEDEAQFHNVSDPSFLIARLGLHGWEPMPVVESRGSSSLTATWYFKRPLPDDAP